MAVLLLDAQQDISDQDAHIAGFVTESGRALVVGINKWDGLDPVAREEVKRVVQRKLPFLSWARFHYLSAQTGHGIDGLMKSVVLSYQAATRKLSTRSSRGHFERRSSDSNLPQGARAAQASVCPPGWPKPTHCHRAWKFPGCRERCLSPVPGVTVSAAF